MKKKKMISLVLAVFMCCGLFAGCGKEKEMIAEMNSQMQKKLDEVNERLSQLKDENEKQSEKIDELTEENAKQKDAIDLLNAQNYNLMGAEIKYTEEAPVYSRREGDVEYVSFENCEGETFEDFAKYCHKNFAEDNFFLLKPITSIHDGHPNMYRDYSIYAERIEDNTVIHPMICERIKMYTDSLGDKYVNKIPVAGGPPCSIDLEWFTVSKDIKGFREVRFGNNVPPEYHYWEEYANIYAYVGEDYEPECIGTCYFNTYAYVSQRWLEEYFYNYRIFSRYLNLDDLQ